MASTLLKTNTIKNSQVFEKDDPTFSWTDKEMEVLFESVQILKVNMEAEGVDWENLRAKYEKIMEIVHENYPKTGDIEEFPHGECIKSYTKHVLQIKLKKFVLMIRRLLIWLSKKSGGERIIMNFYDLILWICQRYLILLSDSVILDLLRG